MRNDQNGSVAVEYVLALSIFVVVVIVGSGGKAGLTGVWLDAFKNAYVNYSKLLGSTDAAP